MLKIVETRYLLIAVATVITLLLFYATSRQYGSDIVDGVRSQTSRIWTAQRNTGPYGPEQAKEHLKHGQSNNVHDIFNETLGVSPFYS